MHIASHLGTLGERDELAVKLRRHDLLGMLALEQLDLGGPPLHLEVSAQPYLLRSELHLREVGQRIVFQSAVQFLVLQRLLQICIGNFIILRQDIDPFQPGDIDQYTP